MSEFLRALRSYDVGSLSKEQLLAEVDRQLSDCDTDPVTLLAWLEEEHARTGLPRDVHEAISEKILGSLGVAVAGEARSAGSASAGPSSVPADDPDSAEASTLLDGPAEASLDTWHTVPHELVTGAPEATPGELLKLRYKLVECLGEGGMGRVYKAIDLRRAETHAPDVYVAVKVLTKVFGDQATSLAVVQREAQRLARLSHPNIVRVIDCDHDGRLVFMTMEYLSGQSLKQKLGATRMTHEESMRVLERIADALSFAHWNGIVHGDLKPANVIITDAREVKVIDFGIARAVAGAREDAEPGAESHAEPISGLTPSYASPEMLEHEPPDPRDDVYALACIAYEMLTGRHPFDRRPATQARDAGLKPVRRRSLSRSQFRALERALRFDRAKRTPSVERFMEELRGDRVHVGRRIALITGAVAALAVGAYFVVQARMSSTNRIVAPGEVFRDCPTCPLMRVIPAGRFEQGSAQGDPLGETFERPKHAVTIGYRFALGVHEVTRDQFAEFARATGRKMQGCAAYDGTWVDRADLSWDHVGYAQSGRHPAVCVSWRDATAYAEWLSRKTGHRYRLPTASEWEYAARAGSNKEHPWTAAGADACLSANVADESAAQRYFGWTVFPCNDGYVYTAPVGTFTANVFGIADLFGNVFEWVQDCWHDNYQGAPSDGSAWVERGCRRRELRGGSWFTIPGYVRAAYRNGFDENYRANSIGFRVVRELP